MEGLREHEQELAEEALELMQEEVAEGEEDEALEQIEEEAMGYGSEPEFEEEEGEHEDEEEREEPADPSPGLLEVSLRSVCGDHLAAPPPPPPPLTHEPQSIFCVCST